MFIEIVSKKEKSSVRSDMSSTRAAPTELHFEGALDAVDGAAPLALRGKLIHDQTFDPVTKGPYAKRPDITSPPAG
jgi:hypothetical protein